MTFNPSIPQSGQRPSDSQSQLLTNFTQLNTIFNEEHITFNAVTDNGEHKKVTFNAPLGVDPNLPDTKASLYTKTVAGDSELFFEKFDNVATANLVSQLTNLPITSGAKHGGTEWTFMSPWGIRFTMGRTAAFSGTSTDTFLIAFTALICVVATADDPNPQTISAQANTTQLSLYTANNVNVRYLAIGT